MNKLLKDLYDCFYTSPELSTQKQEVEECHQALISAGQTGAVVGTADHRCQGPHCRGHIHRQFYLWI